MPGENLAGGESDLSIELAALRERISALEKTGQWWPGQISWTAADVAPEGFLIADGSTFDGARYAALKAALGGSTTLPNLIDCFPVGAGNLYALLTTGGAASVTLTGAQSGIAAHAHTIGGVTGGPSVASTGAGTAHGHTINGAANQVVNGSGGSAANITTGGGGFAVKSLDTEAAHTHSMQSHTHTLPANTGSVTAANAASAHSVTVVVPSE